jgi:hypothetical protein
MPDGVCGQWFDLGVNVEFLLQGFSTINQTSLLRICTVSLYTAIH